MRKKISVLLSVIVALILSVANINVKAAATTQETNSSSSYVYFVDDQADLLTDNEESAIMNILKSISEFGHAGVVLIDNNPYYSAEKYANEYLYDTFGTNRTEVILLIDYTPGQHYIYICAGDDNFKTLPVDKCDVITDNIYRYASDGDFYTCAYEGVSEINDVMNGIAIAEPMKYLSNACLSIILALIIAYFVAMGTSKTASASSSEKLKNMFSQFKMLAPKATKTSTSKTYSPRSSGGGGHGGGHGGGGHGGGGSHGGGHGF